jgi:hypothetical protein
LLRLAQAALALRFDAALLAGDERLQRVLQERRAGRMDEDAAATAALRLLAHFPEK